MKSASFPTVELFKGGIGLSVAIGQREVEVKSIR
jgi:hypothetical protein